MDLDILMFEEPDETWTVEQSRLDPATIAGALFAIPPGHDSWIVGDEPYASIHLLGASDHAARHDDA